MTQIELVEEAAADVVDGFFVRYGRWTAQQALAELPETPRMTVEVLDGSLVVSPRRSLRHQTTVLELGIALKRVVRAAGYGMHPQVKVVVGEELVCPDLTVATRLGDDVSCVEAEETVLVADLVLGRYERVERLARARAYAAGKIGWYLRVELSDDDATVTLYELVDGGYRPVALASAGARFAMRKPFPFDLDPTTLVHRGRGALVDVPPQRGIRLDPPGAA